MDECFKLGIRGFFLPTNTTHFLQPLDHAAFAGMKKRVCELYRSVSSFSTAPVTSLGAHLIPIALEARHILTPARIVASFRDTGIFPFDKGKIIDHAKRNIAAPDAITPGAAAILKSFESVSTIPAPNKVSVKPQNVVKTNQIYSFESLRESQQNEVQRAADAKKEKERVKHSRKQQKEDKENAKQTSKDAKQCRGVKNSARCTATWRSSALWFSCSVC
ncbi:hypothetical protein BDR26DRAFT_995071 [Obelidium mucronatum]|nr:hypothetical protein BDR26DRAFT_995071 [Obelidium mucronatum]